MRGGRCIEPSHPFGKAKSPIAACDAKRVWPGPTRATTGDETFPATVCYTSDMEPRGWSLPAPRPSLRGRACTLGGALNDEQDRLCSACLKQLNSLIGDPKRIALARTLVPCGSAYALSGMRAKGGPAGRLTPGLGEGRALHAILASDDPATFRTGNW